MKNTLEAINTIEDAVRNVTEDLRFLARSFRNVGNSHVAEQLEANADYLSESAKPLHTAWNKDLDGQMSHSQAMMGNMLNLALNCKIEPVE